MRRLALFLCTATALSLFAVTTPAGAMVKKVPTGSGTEEVTVGLQPRSITLHVGAEVGGEEPKKFANLTRRAGGHIEQDVRDLLGSTDNYHGDWQGLIDTFFQNIGAASGSRARYSRLTPSTPTPPTSQPLTLLDLPGRLHRHRPVSDASGCTDPRPIWTSAGSQEESMERTNATITSASPTRRSQTELETLHRATTSCQRAWARSSIC